MHERKSPGYLRNRGFYFLSWCPRRDSNPHTLRHMDLNHARLPIPPRGLKEGEIIADKSPKSTKEPANFILGTAVLQQSRHLSVTLAMFYSLITP